MVEAKDLTDDLDPTKPEVPIVVPDSAAQPVVTTILRYLLTALGGYFVTKGYFTDATANAIIGVLLIVLPTAIGTWLTKHKITNLQAIEPLVKNSLIVLKSKARSK